MTPLHCAANHGYVEIVKALLQKGADVQARSEVCACMHACMLACTVLCSCKRGTQVVCLLCGS